MLSRSCLCEMCEILELWPLLHLPRHMHECTDRSQGPPSHFVPACDRVRFRYILSDYHRNRPSRAPRWVKMSSMQRSTMWASRGAWRLSICEIDFSWLGCSKEAEGTQYHMHVHARWRASEETMSRVEES